MNRQTAALYAPLVAALAAGQTIQANRGTVEDPNWVSLGDDVEFSCPPRLYRIDPQAGVSSVAAGTQPEDHLGG